MFVLFICRPMHWHITWPWRWSVGRYIWPDRPVPSHSFCGQHSTLLQCHHTPTHLQTGRSWRGDLESKNCRKDSLYRMIGVKACRRMWFSEFTSCEVLYNLQGWVNRWPLLCQGNWILWMDNLEMSQLKCPKDLSRMIEMVISLVPGRSE